MVIYKTTNEEKKVKLVITKEAGIGYYLLEVYPIDSDKIRANYLYYRADDIFSMAYNKYGISKEGWKKVDSVAN